MTKEQLDTEDKIMEAAKDVFQKKGMSGARMQEIADKAGINKALLHYYYRTKEKLFEKVLSGAFSLLIPKAMEMMGSDKPVFEKIRFFVDKYISLILNHPYIPGFVINELGRNPKLLSDIFEKNIGFERFGLLDKFDEQIKKEVEAGKMIPIDARTLMVNTISLCIFPIVAKPIVGTILFNNDQKLYKEFLERRKTEVADFIINSIKVK